MVLTRLNLKKLPLLLTQFVSRMSQATKCTNRTIIYSMFIDNNRDKSTEKQTNEQLSPTKTTNITCKLITVLKYIICLVFGNIWCMNKSALFVQYLYHRMRQSNHFTAKFHNKWTELDTPSRYTTITLRSSY